jgi:hypothetical protein
MYFIHALYVTTDYNFYYRYKLEKSNYNKQREIVEFCHTPPKV